jgi:hypothetical protein
VAVEIVTEREPDLEEDEEMAFRALSPHCWA